ncbi:MAG: response regulator [bacterium]|nr:response regulator [bacterium]
MKVEQNEPILLVEDSDEDFAITKRSFAKAGLVNPLFRVEDGETALDFLYRRGQYEAAGDSPRPGVILLDLNLPGTDGREVLKTIKQDVFLRKIPVIVLTTSSADADVELCYDGGANSYIVKPVELDNFIEAVARLRDYWFKIVILPKFDD